MAPRATWKGYVKLAELSVPVALYAAATTSKRVSFHVLNRKTGNRVHREYIDEETEKPVDREQQVKGYEVSKSRYVLLEPDEIAATIPDSDKTIRVESFIECPEVDTLHFDKPYFLAPSDGVFANSFALLVEGMRRKKVAALASAVLFRRARKLMLRADGPGLVAHTLNFDYQVRSAKDAFAGLPDIKVEGEMLDLARHIIETKAGHFDPRDFDDSYDQALAELVRAKLEGRKIEAPKRRAEPKVASLMDALRESAQAAGKAPAEAAAKKAPTRKKAAAASKSRKTAEPAQRRKTG